MNRNRRTQIAQETLSILEQGFFVSGSGRKVEILDDLNKCVDGTVVYTEDDVERLKDKVSAPAHTDPSSIEVSQETTLDAAFRLCDAMPARHVVCLNFASAKHPGGGFLSGSQAQEESLARSSGLYASIVDQKAYYDYHLRLGTSLYSDRMIYSPLVPVFRNDDGRLIDPYYRVSIITSPAVNAGAVMHNEPEKVDQIIPVMRRRMEKVLWVAALHRADALVLGAWGCGVFRNNPEDMAGLWYEQLIETDAFDGRFDAIVFAVPGRTTNNFSAFAEHFGERQ